MVTELKLCHTRHTCNPSVSRCLCGSSHRFAASSGDVISPLTHWPFTKPKKSHPDSGYLSLESHCAGAGVSGCWCALQFAKTCLYVLPSKWSHEDFKHNNWTPPILKTLTTKCHKKTMLKVKVSKHRNHLPGKATMDPLGRPLTELGSRGCLLRAERRFGQARGDELLDASGGSSMKAKVQPEKHIGETCQ